MKLCGVSAEFNPFHNGHKYILEEARKATGADAVIVAMSGDYVQRGEPAFCDKYLRTKAALSNGADLVIEIPTALATGSAQYFARGGVGIFHALGCVDSLVFGSECGSLETLMQQTASVSRDREVHENASGNHAHPAPAISADAPGIQEKSYSSPNDILGTEYLKALSYFSSPITPYAVKRIGTGYHDQGAAETEFGLVCSASALRENFRGINDESQFMPLNVYEELSCYLASHRPLDLDAFSDILYYKLLSEQGSGFAQYFDVYGDLSEKILSYLEQYQSASQFRTLLKSRDIAFSHISRSLLHILLNITKEDAEELKRQNYCPYIRILGFRKEKEALFQELKKSCAVPIISKLADANRQLTPESLSLLQKDIAASHLYQHLTNADRKSSRKDEITPYLPAHARSPQSGKNSLPRPAHKNTACIQNEYRRNIIIV